MIRKEKKAIIQDYQLLFASERGKRVLDDLKKKAPLLMSGLDTKGGVDPYSLCVQQGRLDVIVYIYRMLNIDPHEEREEQAKQGE